jgi:VWFA-related protein
MQYACTSSFAVVLAGLLAFPSRPALQPRTRTVYVSATDKQGIAVTDLQASDVEIKEGGKVREIVSAAPATIPLRIALLVADQGTGAFQLGLGRFMQRLLGHAEFQLVSVIVQPETLVDFSHNGPDLSAALARLGPRGRQQGGQLMEAIQDATTAVQHDGRRPVIVVVRLGGEAASALSADDVREQLRKSGAMLYVVSAAGAQAAAPSQARGTDALSVQQGQFRDAELAEGAFNLAAVLGDGAKESGGHHDQVIATTLSKALEQLADELLHQYEITYTLPDGVKPSDRLSVSSKRKGVTLRAPSRLPN